MYPGHDFQKTLMERHVSVMFGSMSGSIKETEATLNRGGRGWGWAGGWLVGCLCVLEQSTTRSLKLFMSCCCSASMPGQLTVRRKVRRGPSEASECGSLCVSCTSRTPPPSRHKLSGASSHKAHALSVSGGQWGLDKGKQKKKKNVGVRALLCQVPITAISAGAAVRVRPGRGGRLWFLNKLWIVKQCHSQNSWRTTMESPLSHFR